MLTQNVSRPTRLVSRGQSWPVAYVDSHSAAFGEYVVLHVGARWTWQFHSTGLAPCTPPMLVHSTQLLDLPQLLLDLLPLLGLQPASLQGPICPPDLLVHIIVLCYIKFQLIRFCRYHIFLLCTAVEAASGSERSFFMTNPDMWPQADFLAADEIAEAPFPTQATQEVPEESTPLQPPPPSRARDPPKDKFTFPSD